MAEYARGTMTTPGVDEFDWERVVPRIVNPTKIAIINLLRRERRPLSAAKMRRLTTEVEVTQAQMNYHCDTLLKAEVLEEVSAPPTAAANERFFCLAPQE
ncbi:MAG TPA: hypothetical protein VF125_06000 [Solirubrobacterales bacterium]